MAGLLEQGWPGLFRAQVLPRLPVMELAAAFRKDFGRPCKELHVASGTVILQQIMDLTDEETVRQLAFNEEWHYALNMTGTGDDALYMSGRTLWNLRQLVVELELAGKLFAGVTDALVKAFGVGAQRQRIDSVHPHSKQIMETHGNEEGKPELILHVAAAPADSLDEEALAPALEDVRAQGLRPEKALADGRYGSDANVQEAAEQGVTLVAPVMGQAEKKALKLSDCRYDGAGIMTACPLHHPPVKHQVKNRKITVYLPRKTCQACPRQADCPARPGTHMFKITYTPAARRSS